MRSRLKGTTGGAAMVLIACAAMAGPEWEEPPGNDAGKFPIDAQIPVGGGPMAAIKGILQGDPLALGSSDFQDMYKIRICDPVNFRAEAKAQIGFPAFNTQLWLFRADGRGMLANDDDTSGIGGTLSVLPNTANDGTGVTVTAPGIYYLAISGFNSDADADPGISFPIFNALTFTEVSGPDGAGGSFPIVDWEPAAGATGRYRILLRGVAFCCPGDITCDGMVDVDDLNEVLSQWGNVVTVGTFADISPDGVIDVDDLNEVLSNWGSSCPPPAPLVAGDSFDASASALQRPG